MASILLYVFTKNLVPSDLYSQQGMGFTLNQVYHEIVCLRR